MARAFDSLSFRQINLAVAQLEERRATNAEAMGSTPVSEANKIHLHNAERCGESVSRHTANVLFERACEFEPRPLLQNPTRVVSSDGRAPLLQSGCRLFDPDMTHQ